MLFCGRSLEGIGGAVGLTHTFLTSGCSVTVSVVTGVGVMSQTFSFARQFEAGPSVSSCSLSGINCGELLKYACTIDSQGLVLYGGGCFSGTENSTRFSTVTGSGTMGFAILLDITFAQFPSGLGYQPKPPFFPWQANSNYFTWWMLATAGIPFIPPSLGAVGFGPFRIGVYP